MRQRFISQPVVTIICFSFTFLLLSFTFFPAQAQESREVLRLGRGTANALDWRPDGKVLAVGSATGMWLYDDNFEVLAYFEGSSVSPVRWRPSGDRLAFADGAGVHIWSIVETGNSGTNLLSFESSEVFTIAWKPNGELLAVATYKNDVMIWDTDNGEMVYTFADQGYFASWKPDGSQLGIAGENGIRIFDTQDWRIIQQITDKESGAYIAWSPDGETFVTGCFDSEKFYDFNGICFWDAETGKFIDSQELARIEWSPKGDHLLYFGSNGFENVDSWIQVLGWPNRNILIDTGYSAPLRQLVWHPNVQRLTGLAFNGMIVEFDSSNGEIVSEHLLHMVGGQTFKWSPDSLKIVSTDRGVLTLWSLTNPTDDFATPPQFSFDISAGTYVTGRVEVYWTSHSEFISLEETFDYSGNGVHHILKRDANTGIVRERLVLAFVSGCAFSISTALDKFTCIQDDGVHILSVFDERELALLPVMNRRPLIWSPDDSVIAMFHYVKDEHSTIEFRDSETGDLIYSYNTDNFNDFPLWSPDEMLIVTRVTDGTVISLNILDSDTHETISEIAAGYDYAWSSNSQILAVTQENSITFYEAQTGEVMQIIEIEGINALSWSPDGEMLALGMNDGTIRIWNVSDLASP